MADEFSIVWKIVNSDYIARLSDRLTKKKVAFYRANPRRTVDYKLKCIFENKTFYAKMINISSTGAYVVTEKSNELIFKNNLRIIFDLKILGGFTITCAQALIVRVDDEEVTRKKLGNFEDNFIGLGLMFVDLDQIQKEVVNKIVYEEID